MQWGPVLAGIIPSIGVGLIFWLAMRAVVRGDRNEREALARHEQQSRSAIDATEAPQPARDDAGERE